MFVTPFSRGKISKIRGLKSTSVCGELPGCIQERHSIWGKVISRDLKCACACVRMCVCFLQWNTQKLYFTLSPLPTIHILKCALPCCLHQKMPSLRQSTIKLDDCVSVPADFFGSPYTPFLHFVYIQRLALVYSNELFENCPEFWVECENALSKSA